MDNVVCNYMFAPIILNIVLKMQGPHVCAKLIKQAAKPCWLDPWKVCYLFERFILKIFIIYIRNIDKMLYLAC